MTNKQGNRPAQPGQRQTQNPMQPSDPSVSDSAREEEEEEESGNRREDDEEATSIGNRDRQQPNRRSPNQQDPSGSGQDR